jgi:hypothetical protein
LTGAVKASDKPSATLLNKLGEYKTRRDELEKELASTKPSTPGIEQGPQPTTGQATDNLDLRIGQEGPKTLSESINRMASPSSAATATTTKPALGAGKGLETAKPDYFAQAEQARTASEGTLQGKLTEAEAKREEARGRADIGQLAETLGKSFAQIGAGQAGLKSGMNLAGAVTAAPGVDWEARRKEIQHDYELRLGELKDQRKDLADKADRLEKRGEFEAAQKLKKRELDLHERQIDQQGRYQNAEIDNARAKIEASKKSLTDEQFKQANKAIDRYDAAAKNYREATQIYDKMDTAYDTYKNAKNDNERIYATVQLVMLNNKAQDKNSTVREAEYDRLARNGQWSALINLAEKDGVLPATKEYLKSIIAGGGTPILLPQPQVDALYKTGAIQKTGDVNRFASELGDIRHSEEKFGIVPYSPIRPEYEKLIKGTEQATQPAGSQAPSPFGQGTSVTTAPSAEAYLKSKAGK